MQDMEFRAGVIRPIEIYKEAWELIKDQYWLLFGITIVGMLVASVVPIVLVGPAMCGIYICMFQKIDRRPVAFDSLFKGFEYFMPGLIVALIITVPILILIFAIYVPIIGIALAGQRMNESEIVPFLIGTFVFEFFAALIMVCFHTLLIFAFPLIVERKLSGVRAIKISAKAVWHNLAGIAGLMAVGMVVVLIGYAALCIGFYFTLPLIFMSFAVAFRKIFPPLAPASFAPPPPPSVYQEYNNASNIH